MKQTAIEWLEKIRQGQKVQPFDDYEWEIAFNHAKEMEKEQIEEAYMVGYYNHSVNSIMDSEEYYEQNFNL
jgi:hypothetical protein